MNAIAATIVRLLRARGAGKTICPSEVARAVDPERWRARMADVRLELARMTSAREVIVTQRGKVVDVRSARGPIRIAFPPAKPANNSD